MKDKHTLVIVDMQPTVFVAAQKEDVIDGCRRAIKKAIENKNPIIFLEFYGGRGPTATELTSLTDGYDRAFFLSKSEQDGSPQVTKLMRQKKLPKKKIKVCGVNTSACVLSTVKGLRAKLDSDLFVLEDAVGGHWDNTWPKFYRDIKNCTITRV